MDNARQSEMLEIIKQLDLAIASHTEWFDAITRTMVCHLPYSKNDVAEDAHRLCRLGQWYYSTVPDKLRQHPGFIAMEEDHKSMHRLAADLLVKTEACHPVPAEEYDAFAAALGRMRLEMATIKRELESELYNLDALTGAYSRIGMLTRLREQHELVRRNVQPSCVSMMDIDCFKTVNDTYGHASGDKVLSAVARFMLEHIRPYDKLFRYGGEEFLLCMQNTDVKTAYEVVERLRIGLAALPIDAGNGVELHIAMSFGVAQLAADISVERSIEEADQAMYAAKRAGRNTTLIWEPSMAVSP